MRRAWIGVVGTAAVASLTLLAGACGSDPPPAGPAASAIVPSPSGTTGTTVARSTGTTRLVCAPSDTAPADAAEEEGGDTTSTTPTVSACSTDTAPERPTGTDTTGTGRAPRLEALTAYLTSKYGDTPWRTQLSDYDLSTAGDEFELTISVRTTITPSQAIEACKAVSSWSTSTFSDGTITITDHDSQPLAATPSVRNRSCEASS